MVSKRVVKELKGNKMGCAGVLCHAVFLVFTEIRGVPFAPLKFFIYLFTDC